MFSPWVSIYQAHFSFLRILPFLSLSAHCRGSRDRFWVITPHRSLKVGKASSSWRQIHSLADLGQRVRNVFPVLRLGGCFLAFVMYSKWPVSLCTTETDGHCRASISAKARLSILWLFHHRSLSPWCSCCWRFWTSLDHPGLKVPPPGQEGCDCPAQPSAGYLQSLTSLYGQGNTKYQSHVLSSSVSHGDQLKFSYANSASTMKPGVSITRAKPQLV